MVPTSDLLTIQKFIYLLDNFHYEEFTSYLKEIKAELPLRLSQAIRKKMPAFATHEELCVKLYDKYDKNDRLAFNQLASYTFKLSSNLAINYPAYLSPNYSLLQRLVNTGETLQANLLAKLLLEISEKTEDYSTHIFALKFLIQQAFLMKQNTVGVKLSSELDTIYEIEKKCHEILSALRLNLNIAIEPVVSAQVLQSYKNMFRQCHEHPSASLRLLSKYAYIYALYYHEPEEFKNASTNKMILDLERELNNYSHIVFPFMFDIRSNFSIYKLNSTMSDVTGKTGIKDYEELKRHYNSVKFWKSYLNIPELVVMALKTSNYLTTYHHYIHRSDYYNIIPAEYLREIKEMSVKCSEMLQREDLDKYYKNDLINLKLIYSGLLILSGREGIIKGAEELETMLISYQQINLAGTTDSIFLFLMIAYFSTRGFEKCALTFKRYTRITKGKPVYEENDVIIHIYYYLSQWLAFKSRQYLVKLKAAYEDVIKNDPHSEQARAIEELISYFKLPIDAAELTK